MEIRVTKKGSAEGLGHENEMIDVSEAVAKDLLDKGLAENKFAVKIAQKPATTDKTETVK